jgi:hypothetical protein
VRLNHRQCHAVLFHRPVRPSGDTQPLSASDLEPDEVIGVVDDAHAVGFGIADADMRAADCRLTHGVTQRSDARAASRGSIGCRAQRARGALGVSAAEDGVAGDENRRAGGDDIGDIRTVDTAVDFNVCR